MLSRKIRIAFAIGVLAAAGLGAQATAPKPTPSAPKPTAKPAAKPTAAPKVVVPTATKGSKDLGMILNLGETLPGVESYQAGLGFKIGDGKSGTRWMVDFMLNGVNRSFSLMGGLTYEYHIFPAPISPYIGLSVGAGYQSFGDVSTSIPLSAGSVAGVEVFIFDFLSVFAEYSLSCDVSIDRDIATAATNISYKVDTKLGNDSRLGVVLYFMRKVKR